MTTRNRVHWAVTLLTGMIGLTVYAASDDLLVSLLLALALGWSALVATLLLLARRQAGYLVAAATAAGLLAFEVIDWTILGFRWLHAFYAVIAVLILVGVVGLEMRTYPEHLHRRSRRMHAGEEVRVLVVGRAADETETDPGGAAGVGYRPDPTANSKGSVSPLDAVLGVMVGR